MFHVYEHLQRFDPGDLFLGLESLKGLPRVSSGEYTYVEMYGPAQSFYAESRDVPIVTIYPHARVDATTGRVLFVRGFPDTTYEELRVTLPKWKGRNAR